MASSSALTLKQATTKIIKLLRPTTPFPTTFTRRSFSSSAFPLEEAGYTLNPVQTAGPKAAIALKTEGNNAKYKTMRVMMPGVGKDGYKVRLDEVKNTIFFEGKGEIELEGEESGRTYEGKLEFKPDVYKVAKVIKTEIKYGILWIYLESK
ncbi:hypothetical protein ACH5RR_038663 [Cinchona calisaya]|uniref:Uncharacterized protein n=1 Tax=Cinchona calisaya TaxID=153742 RepID=A0ABD2Y1C6_9GENT